MTCLRDTAYPGLLVGSRSADIGEYVMGSVGQDCNCIVNKIINMSLTTKKCTLHMCDHLLRSQCHEMCSEVFVVSQFNDQHHLNNQD